MGRRIFQKSIEALIDHKSRPRLPAALPDLLQKLPVRGDPCRVVGLTEKYGVRILPDLVQKILTDPKALFFLQQISADLPSVLREGRFIFRKSRRSHQEDRGRFFLRLQRPGQAEDYIRGPIAAEDPFRRDPFRFRQPLDQPPAERIRIPVRSRSCLCDSLTDSLGDPQGIDVHAEVQGLPAIFDFKTCPVTSVGQFLLLQSFSSVLYSPPLITISPQLTAIQSRTARIDAAYSIRFVRRMSSGSMGRRASPMVGLS